MLDGITTGKVQLPYLFLVYGVEGIGKTTFAADAPGPIFIGSEAGTNNLDVARFNAFKIVNGNKVEKTYEDFLRDIDQLVLKDHQFKTLIIDSVDWLEPMIYDYLIRKWKVDQIEDVGGGFGKWVNVVLSEWKTLISRLNNVRNLKGMNIILIGHYHVKKFDDPQSADPYERYLLKLNEKASAVLREYVDAVLFFNYETFTKKAKGASKAKAFSDGDRYIFTTKTVAYDAKNRFGLPEKIKLDQAHPFIEFEKVLKGSSTNDVELIKSEISEMLIDLKDEALKPKIDESVQKAGNNFAQLCKIRDRIKEIMNGGN